MRKYQIILEFNDSDKQEKFTLSSERKMTDSDILSSCFTELKNNEFYFITNVILVSGDKGFDKSKKVFFDYKIETI